MCPLITIRELATILAALRYWQGDLRPGPADVQAGSINCSHFQDPLTPLTAQEIDELCERLNCN